MKNITGKTVLITGAGMGMGRLFALKFANASCNLVLVDINKQALEKTASELHGATHTYTYICDISNNEQIQSLVSAVHNDAGLIDIIVNNAGVLYGYPFLKSPDELIGRTIDVNVKGSMLITKAFLPDLISRKNGHIIMMASASSLIGVPDLVAYTTSKHAIAGFSESLRLEMKKYGFNNIKITLAYPHFVDTGMVTGVRSSVLLRPEDVVNKIFNAMLHDKLYVYIPWWLRFIPLLLYILPTSLGDWILFKAGVSRTMESWVGHAKQ
ncbi:MAG: SDR family oxidoreductase [bacterium]